jgi:hypothetical protein
VSRDDLLAPGVPLVERDARVRCQEQLRILKELLRCWDDGGPDDQDMIRICGGQSTLDLIKREEKEVPKMMSCILEPFQPYHKISRLSRDIVITEKIDGTNAQIHVLEDGRVLAGSRNRYLKPVSDIAGPTDDNFGFAAWVLSHEEELRELGPGRHYGEWWGSGIQRRYGLTEKRFSLFNVARWNETTPPPDCCYVVPVLYRGVFSTWECERVLGELEMSGSIAARGFMQPEGIVIFHSASGSLFKKTIEGDEAPKSKAKS